MIIDQNKEKFNKQIEILKSELQKIRTGRANPQIIETIMVEAYGVNAPLKQLASISVSDARTLIVEPWDKSIIKDLEKALSKNDLGLSVVNEGSLIRISVPSLTEESRKELIKVLGGKIEQCRINIRQIRDELRNIIIEQERASEITEDDKYLTQKSLDEYVNELNKKIKSIAEEKEKEIMTV